MQFLKANTQVIVTVGPFVDVGDGFTPQTDIALSGNEAELLKHGSTSVVDISGATWAAVTSCRGYYSLTLTTAHTDTEGMLVVIVQDDSDCLPVKQEYMVLAEAAYDSLFTAKDTGYMDVNVKAVSEDTAAADNLESACDNYSVTRGLTGTALPAAAADAAGGVPISDAGGLDIDTKLANTNEVTAARMGALTDWINGGRLDLILDIIAADTTTDIPALIATAQADLDTITGAAGVVLDADAITAAKIADNAIATEHLAASAVSKIWAEAVESNATVTAQEVLSILLSACAGVTTAAGATFKDPSGTDTRITATVNASNERTAITLAPSS